RTRALVSNPGVARLLPAQRVVVQGLNEQVMLDYMLMAMINEAALVLEERVVAGPRELDLATVFGMGFPPFRGGLLRWADQLGTREVLSRLQNISNAPDIQARGESSARFKAAALIRSLAEDKLRFHDPNAVQAADPRRTGAGAVVR